MLVALFVAASYAGATEIDVLIAYTDTVEHEHGNEDGVLAHVLGSIASANIAFENSEVDVTLNLVHLVKVNYEEDSSDIGVDLDHMAESDGVMDELFGLRTEMGADLVCLFTGDSPDDSAGIAYLLKEASGDKATGFSVVQSQHAMSGYIFQHEIGHNLGAAHDRDNASSQGLFNYSYGHRYLNAYEASIRTVMAYQPGWIINQFSNPEVSFEGAPTGVSKGLAEAADNSGTFEYSAPIVANYLPSVARLPLANAGKDTTVPDNGGDGIETIALKGRVLVPYSEILSWTWSWSGGSMSGESIEAQFPVGETIVTLTVVDALGRSDQDTLTVEVLELVPVRDISSGLNYTLLLDDANVLRGFGTDVIGSVEGVLLSEKVKSADAGFGQLLIVSENGDLWGVGSNFYGALGLGSDTNSYEEPIRLPLSSVSSVAVGSENSLVLMENGSLWGMGKNGEGQIGVGNISEVRTPTQIVDGGVKAMAIGFKHSLFVKEDGSLWAMGSNESGALGLGGPGGDDVQSSPIMIMPSGVKSVSVGDSSSFALKDDGSLWAFGRNDYGQLGDGTRSTKWAPVVVIPSGVAQIDAGNLHTVILKTDGSVWTMGANANGQLGSASNVNRSSPGKIIFGEVIDIVAGAVHSLFLRSNGSVWGAGSNNYGQLPFGYYDYKTRSQPEEVFAAPILSASVFPTANAGENIEIMDTGQFGTEWVDLNGSKSIDDWMITSWNWTWEGGNTSGQVVSGEFPVGETVVTLTVTDDLGLSSETQITVAVINEELQLKQWLDSYFDESTIESFGDSVLELDPDFDGLSNFWERKLNLDPSKGTSRVEVSTGIVLDVLTITASPYVEGVTYNLLALTESTDWEPSGIEFETTGSTLFFRNAEPNVLYKLKLSLD